MLPMLATPASRPPRGDDWRHEVKWDGIRMIADVRGHQVHLSTRSGRDATDRFPELASVGTEYDDLAVDGEVILLDGGVPSFAALADRIHIKDRATADAIAAHRPVTFMVFDVLRLFGADVTGLPWSQRRQLLEQLSLHGSAVQVPDTYPDGDHLLAATRDQGLEGVVSKRVTSVYLPGRRSPDWVKVAHRPLVSVVIIGWHPETGSASRLGSLVVAAPGSSDASGWEYRGRVGSGLSGSVQVQLLAELHARAIDRCPLAEVPAEEARGTRWVRPEIVIDVRSLGYAGRGRLRQAVFHLLRTDLTAADLRSADGDAVGDADADPDANPIPDPGA